MPLLYSSIHSEGAIGGGEVFGDDVRNAVLNDVHCSGSEGDLLSCVYNASGTEVCGPLKDAHVVCQGNLISLTYGYLHYVHYHNHSPTVATTVHNETCQDRDLRLIDGYSVREGRVEVCYNQAWGTICNVVYGTVAAGVFCRVLDFRRE